MSENDLQPSTSPKPSTQGSSVDSAHDEILKRIVTGELKEGEPIKGSVLAKTLGLSRTPVKHAIERLCSEGLLTQQLNHRATVAVGAERWFMSLHEVRILLEPHAAQVAASSFSADCIARLYSLAEQFESESDFEKQRTAAFQLDHALHTSIAEASGNLMIQSIIHRCMSFKRFAYLVPNDPLERLTRSHREHLEILRAIEQKDSQTASAAMLFHLRSTFRELPDTHVV